MIRLFRSCALTLTALLVLLVCLDIPAGLAQPQSSQPPVDLPPPVTEEAMSAAATTPSAFTQALSQILSAIPAHKVVAFVQFSEPSGEQSSFSQAVFQQVEPLVVAAGLRRQIAFIERQDLKLILDEWDLNSLFKTEGGDSGAQALLGADYLMTGKARLAGKEVQCSLKLVELASGRIISSVVGQLPADNSLLTAEAPPSPPPTTASDTVPDTSQPGNSATSEDGRLTVWTTQKSYAIGDHIEIFFTVTEPLYVEIIDVTPDGEITRIFPNPVQTDNLCQPGRQYRIPPQDGAFDLVVTPPAGIDRLKVLASTTPTESSAAVKTRGIQFTRRLVESSETRASLSFTIR